MTQTRRAPRGRLLSLVALAWAVPALVGCLPLAGREARPAASSHGCVERVLQARMPAAALDREAHCLAAGLIARYCSPAEAWLATAAKELRDLLGPGDADVADMRAGSTGMTCARTSADDDALRRCCAQGVVTNPR